MGWVNNNSIIKKYQTGDYARSTYATQDIVSDIEETDLIGQIQKQLLGEQTQDVKTDFSERKQEELEKEANKAKKKASKYGKWGAIGGTLAGFIPGWGKFAKMGIDALTAGKQSQIFKDVAKKGKGLAGTFLETIGKDFTKGYEKLAGGFDPLKAGTESILKSMISDKVSSELEVEGVEGLEDVGEKAVEGAEAAEGVKEVETLAESIKGMDIAEDAGYTKEQLQRVSDYAEKDWALPETSKDWTAAQFEKDVIDPEALDAYREYAADFEPGKLGTKAYGDMNFQERLKDYFTPFKDFQKGKPTENLTELIKQFESKAPLFQQLFAKTEDEDLDELFKSWRTQK